MPGLGLAGWIDRKIGDAVVHRRHPGGVHEAEPGGLHRRRAARECEQSIAHGMARQVDQDVDLLAPDQPGQMQVGHRACVEPLIDIAPDACAHMVGRAACKHANLEFLAVMKGEHRLDEIGQRMVAQIGRHIAHAQPAAGRKVKLQGRRGARQRVGEAHAPFAECGQGFRRIAAIGAQQIGAKRIGVRIVRRDGDRLIHQCDGRRVRTHGFEANRLAINGIEMAGVHLQDEIKGLDRRFELEQAHEAKALARPGIEVARIGGD